MKVLNQVKFLNCEVNFFFTAVSWKGFFTSLTYISVIYNANNINVFINSNSKLLKMKLYVNTVFYSI